MADHSITITNAIVTFGPAPSTKWGVGTPYTMTWGTSKWGEGTEDLMCAFEKVLSNSITPSDDNYYFNIEHLISLGSISPTFEMSSETLTDGSGYYYNFISNTSEAEDRDATTYTQVSNSSSSWTEDSDENTSWSES